MQHIDSLYLLTVPPAVLAVSLIVGVAYNFRNNPVTRQAYLLALATVLSVCVAIFYPYRPIP